MVDSAKREASVSGLRASWKILSLGVRAAAVVGLTAAAGCGLREVTPAPKAVGRFVAQPGATAPVAGEGSTPACPVFDPLDTTQHLRKAVEPLMAGDVATARDELRLALCQDPDDATAKSLVWQLDAVAEDALGHDFFCYEVQSGDSMPRIAKRFLGDPYRFFLLARYNEIEAPGRLRLGQCLRIPGPPEAPGDQGERLYRCGVSELGAGQTKSAFEFFRDASRIASTRERAQAKVLELTPAVVALYRKEGAAALRAQSYGRATHAFRTILEIDPANESVERLLRDTETVQRRLVDLLSGEAQEALERGERDEAVADLEKVLEMDPHNEGARSLRSQALGR